MLADLGDTIDAVTVSTPDHHHFHASAIAMRAGKHVYCQKPLTHGIWEARMMAKIGQDTGVVTQMGNQAHANSHMRRCIELIRAGVVGKVQEIHAWTNRPIWPQGFRGAARKNTRTRRNRLAAVDRSCPLCRLQPVDRALCVARLVGLWHRGARRHGVSHHGHGILGDESRSSRPRLGQAKRRDRLCHRRSIPSSLGTFPKASTPPRMALSSIGTTDTWMHISIATAGNSSRMANEYNHPGEDVLEGVDFSKVRQRDHRRSR